MITTFGRYSWARLPFRLRISSEIVQRKLTEAVGDLNGTLTITIDIIIMARCGQTDEEATRDQEMKLFKLHEWCKEQKIILIDEKIRANFNRFRGCKTFVWNGTVHGSILTRSRERDGTDTRTDKEIISLELIKRTLAFQKAYGSSDPSVFRYEQ